MKTEILYGIHPVSEALKAGRRDFLAVYIAKEKASERLGKIVTLAESLKIPVKKIAPAQLKSMAGTDLHQGVGARVSLFPVADMTDILHGTDTRRVDRFLLLLDNVVDPHNLGALVRTALCVGIEGIIVPKDRSAPPTPAVSRASAGALEHVTIAQVTNMVNTIKALKETGVWIAGMDRNADRTVFEADLTCSVGIVVGGEGKGMRPLVRKNCDFLISIPQKGSVDSLNASVAGAVVMYEAFRQRHTSAG